MEETISINGWLLNQITHFSKVSSENFTHDRIYLVKMLRKEHFFLVEIQ